MSNMDGAACFSTRSDLASVSSFALSSEYFSLGSSRFPMQRRLERRLKEKLHGLKDVVQSQGDNTKEDARRAVESALRKHKRFATAETRVALQEARQKRDAL